MYSIVTATIYRQKLNFGTIAAFDQTFTATEAFINVLYTVQCAYMADYIQPWMQKISF